MCHRGAPVNHRVVEFSDHVGGCGILQYAARCGKFRCFCGPQQVPQMQGRLRWRGEKSQNSRMDRQTPRHQNVMF